MSLPLPWVDRIFTKLTLAYGQEFLRRWTDIDLGAVKSDWMHELSAFESAPHAIAFALDNLPEKPPSVIQFKALCRQAPPLEVPRLEAPKADPARVAAELAKLSPIFLNAVAKPNPRQWAHDILARKKAGEWFSPTVLKMAKDAVAAS
jgi:hypothetical protein